MNTFLKTMRAYLVAGSLGLVLVPTAVKACTCILGGWEVCSADGGCCRESNGSCTCVDRGTSTCPGS
jgi:hypothetical protein